MIVDGVEFVHVPGGRVTLGYDGRRFTGDADGYAASAEAYGLPADVREFVDSVTSPPREVEVPSLLVAVEAQEAGLVRVPADHPEVADLVAQAGPGPVMVERRNSARVRVAGDGTVEAWLITTPTHADVVARLAAAGQRLLTADEWEHACGAGARTLFRWGDERPADGHPHLVDGPHRVPNAFGLRIGHDPYRPESTADPTVVCGGDAGALSGAGEGPFLTWLPLATAFRDPGHGPHLLRHPGKMYVRPAIEVT